MGEKFSDICEEGDEGGEQIRCALEKVESGYKHLKSDNCHLKEKLQEIIKQLDIYQSEKSSNKDFEKRRLELGEAQMRKEIKELIEKNCDLQMSLNEVNDDYKLLKEECDRL